MADIVAGLKSLLKVKEVSLDNGVFKLFSVGSVTLCLLGSLLCAATQYFGSPITCEFDGSISAELASKYCWIHGTNWIRREYQDEFDCIVSQTNVANERDAPDTSYYQWVVFFLLVQAGLFALPYKVWKVLEKGLVQGFVNAEARSAFVLSDEERTRDLLRTYVRQFNCILHHNNRYFVSFVLCELLNIAFLFVNFYATNAFLNYHFSSYGFDVWHYYRTIPALRTVNPMCEAFPTKVSCTMKVVAEAGGVNQKNGFCILSQNIVNEKIFLLLFFWYLFLFLVSAAFIVYRLCTIALPQFRQRLISSHLRGEPMDVAVRRVLDKCHVGDWFVLNQIGKNVNSYFFREFIEELQHDLGKSRGTSRPFRDVDNSGGMSLMKYESDMTGATTGAAGVEELPLSKLDKA